MQLGLDLLSSGQTNRVSQAFLLTDGENELGDHQRCLRLAQQAAQENITLSTLGFGYHWNPDLLEQIADAARGSLSFIEFPEDVNAAFDRLFNRVVSVGLTNAHLLLHLSPGVRLAGHRPVAQVAPDVMELPPPADVTFTSLRIGDLLVDAPRTLLANLYLPPFPVGIHPVAQVHVKYDDPAQQRTNLLSTVAVVRAKVSQPCKPQPHPQVVRSVLALAKYRQMHLAEEFLAKGNRARAADLFTLAAQTALKIGDKEAASLLLQNVQRLRNGEDLPLGDRRKTRIMAKTQAF
jgi:Ca-activated chloride channel family protein